MIRSRRSGGTYEVLREFRRHRKEAKKAVELSAGIYMPYSTKAEIQNLLQRMPDEVTASFRSGVKDNSLAEVQVFTNYLTQAFEAGLRVREVNYDMIKRGTHITLLFRAEILCKSRKEKES